MKIILTIYYLLVWGLSQIKYKYLMLRGSISKQDMMRKDEGWSFIGLAATNWNNDYRLHQFWLDRCLAVWAAIPVEFRGAHYPPLLLEEKVKLMIDEIKRLRLENERLKKNG